MRSIHMISILFAVVILVPTSASAATINVPADYPTIQQAIDAAVSGDIVLVAPGTYVENISFNGKGIEVASSDGAEVTVIDGNNAWNVVRFDNDEEATSFLNGFTITNGKAWGYGGGIKCDDSAPRIENNIIKDNSAKKGGGGIYCSMHWFSSPTIHNNTISDNVVTDPDGMGGGILCDEDTFPSIDGNMISGNMATISGGRGGGIYCAYSSSPSITNNTIVDNACDFGGGGIRCMNATLQPIRNNLISRNIAGGSGGGIYSYNSLNLVIEDNTISENSARSGCGLYLSESYGSLIQRNIISKNNSTATDGQGGGILITGSSIFVRLNEITGNSVAGADGCGGGIYCRNIFSPKRSPSRFTTNRIIGNEAGKNGGGICCYRASPSIENNWFARNVSGECGGGIFLEFSDPPVLNNTFYTHTAGDCGGAIHCFDKCNVLISNCILWNSHAAQGASLWVGGPPTDPSDVTIEYSNIEGGSGSTYLSPPSSLSLGDNIIDDDPLFVDAPSDNLHLTWGSPCINRGNNAIIIGADIDGNVRPQAGIVDMGADEFFGLHRLDADVFTVSDDGGIVNFTLDCGIENAGRLYYLLGSFTGTVPGYPLPGGISKLRISWDYYTTFMWNLLNSSVYQNFWIHLDATGSSTAQLNVPPLPSGFVGHKMYYAFCLGWPWEFVSNPVEIEIVP